MDVTRHVIGWAVIAERDGSDLPLGWFRKRKDAVFFQETLATALYGHDVAKREDRLLIAPCAIHGSIALNGEES